jgi:hypothetical protein
VPDLDTVHAAAALDTFPLDVVDLVVNGATIRQVSEHFKVPYKTARSAYMEGLQQVTDRSIDRTIAMREEITARQRILIFSNMARARAGDRAAAQIVARADALLASVWGLRSIRIELPDRPPDPQIAAAMEGYLSGLAEQAR